MLIEPLLEVAQVAHRLNVNPRKVWRLIREGKLPAIWLETRWRIDPRDLHAFIEARRNNGNGNGHGAPPANGAEA